MGFPRRLYEFLQAGSVAYAKWDRRENLAVARYLTPGEFAALAAAAREAGIAHVAAGPLVRSSWRARETHAALAACAG